MEIKKLLQEISDHMQEVIAHDTPFGATLWRSFLDIHPADIVDFFERLNKEDAQALFKALPEQKKITVFHEFSDMKKVHYLSYMSQPEIIEALNSLPADELTDLFDLCSDEDLKKYLNVLHRTVREQVVALLKFPPQSAGGIMATDALTLMEDFTVEKSIKLIQRLSPSREIHHHIFVVDKRHKLIGYIQLEDLVLQKPNVRISEFIRPNEFVAQADEDQETVAKNMVHYNAMLAPVTDEHGTFLGVIPSETLVDVIVEEAQEDVHKMASMPYLKYSYFDLPFFYLFYQRGYVLIALLIAEQFSGTILRAYGGILTLILTSFIPMITSAGGNAGSQASAVVIQGMASGDIDHTNIFKLLRREFLVATCLGLLLGLLLFVRVYYIGGTLLEGLAIGGSLSLIIIISIMLGNCIPLVLRRLNVDPAFSAGPFLATMMDILGIFIYCYTVKLLLS